ncbi:MAG: anthranilate synthase family protein [Candidatus Altarchaeum sp.]|nr:anthranilate synthase family protein [Candidatus Altarchaeum sp.]
MKPNFKKPFAIIKRKGDIDALVFEGEAMELNKLEDIPGKKGKENLKENFDETYDTISAIPFSQIKERNFKVYDEGAKILCINIERQSRVTLEELFKFLPDEKIELANKLRYNYSDKEYETIIKSVIENEIGNGEGANFVIPRKGTAKIKDMSVDKALSIYKNVLRNETGSHWNFIFYNGDKFLIGASPETHISIRDGEVMMHPISGTFKKETKEKINLKKFKENFLKFLLDKKEINELFMVVDEELKMMAKICAKGGMIIGPLLKEMSALIHTEYLLSGKSNKDIIEILRESMHAATVTGSPLENACRVIYKYEGEDRRYYGSPLVLIGRDERGTEFLDSSILIRSVEINKHGEILTRVGSTLVRDSVPSEEVTETESKIKGIMNSIQSCSKKQPLKILPYVEEDAIVLKVLQQRNQKLSKFWFFSQEGEDNTSRQIKSKNITIIDNEDDFCYMLKHILSKIGAKVNIIRYDKYNFDNAQSDITIIGPGPGNPNDTENEKMKIIADITLKFIKSEIKFVGICLGHQFICKSLGIKVVRKEKPFQGVQETIDLFGKKEVVGFYNTFAGKYEEGLENLKELKFNDVKISYAQQTKEIHAMRGRNFVGFQFHPESILTQNGMEILRDELINLIRK